MSLDEGGSPYARAILDCAATAECKTEFLNMIAGIDFLSTRLCEAGVTDSDYCDEIMKMSDEIYKYLPDEPAEESDGQ